MSPLLVLQNLAHNSTATLAVVKVKVLLVIIFITPGIHGYFILQLSIFAVFSFVGLHYPSFTNGRRTHCKCKWIILFLIRSSVNVVLKK